MGRGGGGIRNIRLTPHQVSQGGMGLGGAGWEGVSGRAGLGGQGKVQGWVCSVLQGVKWRKRTGLAELGQ